MGVATLIVTTLFLAFTVLMWFAMLAANKHAEKVYKESAGESEENLRLTRESNEQTRRAVEISEQQAAALASAVMVQERSLELQTRAWLVCNSVDHSVRLDGNLFYVHVRVILENVGRGVPATNIRSKLDCWITDDEAPPTDDAPPTDEAPISPPKMASTGVLGAGAKTLLSDVLPFTHAKVVSLDSREKFLFIVGRTLYDDYFGKDRLLRFCARYKPTGPMMAGTWSQASAGNEVT